MPDPITLGVDWIPRLVKQLLRVRGRRKTEIANISDVFGDVLALAERYVDPDCQLINPADLDEDEPDRMHRSPIRQWVSGFLKGEFQTHDGRHVVFVLSDAGMGKTSLLMMLKTAHVLRFWPSYLDFHLLKLGANSIDQINEIKNRRRTVLLLDALDEDPTAWERIDGRLHDLLKATENFRQVVITCRTQFFPRGGKAPIERLGRIEVEGYVCNLLYLSPFSDEQVEEYLRRIYPISLAANLIGWAKGQGSEIDRARQVIVPMKSLRMRPMLLAYVREIMESDIESWSEYAVYEALVRHWLLREIRKQLKPAQNEKVLLEACLRLACRLQETKRRSMPWEELEELITNYPVDISALSVGGRSLLNRTSQGEYRFAHYTVQEFLTALWLVTKHPYLPRTFHITPQIEEFVFSWYEESQDGRFQYVIRFPFCRSLLPEAGAALSHAELQGADFENANLLNADLQYASLQEAKLQGADLQGADLHGANLKGAELQGVRLQGADLQKAVFDDADLRRADLQRVSLQKAKLQGADLQGADLQGAILLGANLKGARCQNANLEDVSFQGANLESANLQKATLKGYDFRGTSFRQAELQEIDLRDADLEGVNLQAAKLIGARLHRARLKHSNLRRADLQRAKLKGANLEGADLRGADLRDADLRDADCERADLRSTSLKGAKMLGALFKRANLQGADLRRRRFKGANLEGSDLRNSNLQSAILRGSNLKTAKLGGAKLRMADLQDADLHGSRGQKADLQDAHLQGANLERADLREVNFQGADLRGCKLLEANLENANLQYADLRHADFQGADLQHANLSGADLQHANLYTADLRNTILKSAKISNTFLPASCRSDS